MEQNGLGMKSVSLRKFPFVSVA